MEAVSKPRITYVELVWVFIKVGSNAFGGWSTTSLLLEKELVDKRQFLSSKDIQGPVTYAQIIPGGTQAAIVSGVGYKLHGVSGSLLATVFYLLPSMTLITIFSILYFQYLHSSQLASHLNLLRAALGGIVLANAYRIGQRHATHSALWLLVGAAFLAKFVMGVNAVFIILLFGLAGVSLSIIRIRRQTL